MLTYWAAREPREVVAESVKKVDAWFQHVRDSGLLGLWRRSLAEYYAGAEQGGSTGTAGDSDELTTIKVNHVRNLGEHIVSVIAGQPPQFQPQATNNDHASAAASKVAQGILDDAVTHGDLGRIRVEAMRRAHALSEGWASVLWDRTQGDVYGVDPASGSLTTTGDVTYRLHAPTDVARDFNRDDNRHKWLIVRVPHNRWDLIAEHPEFADAIAAAPSKIQEKELRPRLVNVSNIKHEDSDEVYVYELWHERTPALPQGAHCKFVNEDAFWDFGPLPYDRLPLFCLAPENQIGTYRGYSTAYDLLPLQQTINACYSVMLTNINAFGVQSIWTPPGSNVDVEELTAGLTRVISAVKPEALNLAQTSPEIPAMAQNLIQQAEILSGVNAVRRGNIDATGKLSGAAYALIDAKLLDLAISAQDAYRQWLGDIATHVVRLFQKFATTERVVQIVGLSGRSEALTFTGESLKPVRRVDIEMGNPLQRTVSGRMEIAGMLADRQMLKTPEQFVTVLTTGRLEPVVEGQSKEYLGIKAENEWLGDGKVPPVLRIDNHALHIMEHRGVLSSPETRNDPRIVESVLAHISLHEQEMAALAPPPMPGPEGDVAPGPGGGSTLSAAAQGPKMPSMPSNPQTGEKAPDAGLM